MHPFVFFKGCCCIKLSKICVLKMNHVFCNIYLRQSEETEETYKSERKVKYSDTFLFLCNGFLRNIS
jgi:hypothetical protein